MTDWLKFALEDPEVGGPELENAVTIAAGKVLERFKVMFAYCQLQAFWYDAPYEHRCTVCDLPIFDDEEMFVVGEDQKWYCGRHTAEGLRRVDGPPAVEHECDVYCEEYGCLERKRGKNS